MSVDRLHSLGVTGQHLEADGQALLRIVDHYALFFQIELTEVEKGDFIANLLAPTTPGVESVSIRTETKAFVYPREGE